MNATAQAQFVALCDAHVIDPDELPMFEQMSEAARARFTAARLGHRLRESLPAFVRPPGDWREAAEAVRNVMEAEPQSGRDQLRASGVPVRGGRSPLVTDELSEQVRALRELGSPDESVAEFSRLPTDARRQVVREVAARAGRAGIEVRGGREVLRESGVSLVGGERHRPPSRPDLTAKDALRECGVPTKEAAPMREASAASSAGQVERISTTGSQDRDPASDSLPCGSCAATGIRMGDGEDCPVCGGTGYVPANMGDAAGKRDRQRISDPGVVGAKFAPVEPDGEDDEPMAESARAALATAGVPLVRR
jgi:hypothetical protein